MDAGNTVAFIQKTLPTQEAAEDVLVKCAMQMYCEYIADTMRIREYTTRMIGSVRPSGIGCLESAVVWSAVPGNWFVSLWVHGFG